ncbi:hypothetical protein KSS87_007618 [Heliosperma pusillum]|nr:hypothetical protein KSS87_007618 [Heliosperma pusillum]
MFLLNNMLMFCGSNSYTVCGSIPVHLNVYDIAPAHGYAYWIGLGAHHSGVEGFLCNCIIPKVNDDIYEKVKVKKIKKTEMSSSVKLIMSSSLSSTESTSPSDATSTVTNNRRSSSASSTSPLL